jgi:DNA helicase II / ATP-dependent DNA helicase PcrA
MVNEHATGSIDGIGQQDHSITSEYWIVGPPGTGKTTTTGDQAQKVLNKYGSNSALLTSFSRAAAAELANCDLPINPGNVGTLHSHCFRALGRPDIAEAHVKEWNRSYSRWAITPAKGRGRLDGEDSIEDDLNSTEPTGDSLLRELNRYRGLMIDPNQWPATVREFERKWVNYKRERGLLDFCDLIETCVRDVAIAPSKPVALFVDEAQDLNMMQQALIRKWGRHASYSVLAFDDDQTLFSFIGASPDAILDAQIPDDHKIILRQSHRVPRSIHQLANGLIHQVSRRQEKIHLPRPASGAVRRLSIGTYKSPEYFIPSSAMKHLERGKTIMFLASCSYMLRPIIQVLRKNAIPFHNPYRKANGLWNPLRIGPRSIGRRMLSLLVAHPEYGEGQRQWTHHELALWVECLRSKGVLRSGARELVQSADGKQPVTVEPLSQIFEPGALASLLAAFDGDWRALLEWWRARVAPDYRRRIQFPADAVARCGPRTLIEEPQVMVGTIHSVKGGEADVVYFSPDLSRAGDEQYQILGPPRDSVIRVFYVRATRARETLYICGRETARSIVL